MENETVIAPEASTADAAEQPVLVPVLVADELLIEEISIDGMCGVY